MGQLAPALAGDTMNPELCGKTRFDLDAQQAPATVIVFGASHCYPCLLELPALKEVEEAHRKNGLSMALVVLDQTGEGLELMQTFVEKRLALGFAVIDDPGEKIADRYLVETLPTLFLIGPKGRILWRETGYRGSTIDELNKRLGAIFF